MVELKLVWWPQFPTEEFEYHYLPLTATVGTPRFEYEEAPYFQRLLLHANAAQVTRKKAVISCLAAAMVHGIPVLNLERSTRAGQGAAALRIPGDFSLPQRLPAGVRHHGGAGVSGDNGGAYFCGHLRGQRRA